LHALIFEKHHAITLIKLRGYAHLSKLCSEKAMTKLVNILCRKGGDPKISLREILTSLCKNLKRDMLVAYLRNQTIMPFRGGKRNYEKAGSL